MTHFAQGGAAVARGAAGLGSAAGDAATGLQAQLTQRIAQSGATEKPQGAARST
jgi:hypothetical protein